MLVILLDTQCAVKAGYEAQAKRVCWSAWKKKSAGGGGVNETDQ